MRASYRPVLSAPSITRNRKHQKGAARTERTGAYKAPLCPHLMSGSARAPITDNMCLSAHVHIVRIAHRWVRALQARAADRRRQKGTVSREFDVTRLAAPVVERVPSFDFSSLVGPAG
jgi:hypothetical protein